MKRSEVNEIIAGFREFLEMHRFMLPEWAYWSPEECKGKYDICGEIVNNKLGWDITDFGSADFNEESCRTFSA